MMLKLKMRNRYLILLAGLGGAVILAAIFLYLKNSDIAVLNPKGLIASKERHLMITTVMLMLIVVIPVFILTLIISVRYRESNTKARYTPDWDHNLMVETIWWAIPAAIISVLAVITWQSSYQLDPFASLGGSTKPLNVQVVALQWKWLFIYPDQHIASVNYLQIPTATPINFQITADAPMNSFWIPQLGGQIYAMAGMSTKLHLIADQTGTYNGSSANLSGRGFAGMKFLAKSTSQADFDKWVKKIKSSSNSLTLANYNQLSKPSENITSAAYSNPETGLYDSVVMKYMMPMPKPTAESLAKPVSSNPGNNMTMQMEGN